MKNIYLFFLLASFSAHSQLSWNGNSYSLESSLFVSSDSTLPFWMRSQTYGEVPVASQFLQLKGSMHHEYDSTYSLDKKLQKFGLGYGTSMVANVGKVNQFIISQGYLKARYGIFELWAGRRKEVVGLVDSTLSSGSLIWGGNAIPIPKIQLEIPNYVPILGKGLVSIKGSYAHGWFGSTDSVKNYLLHQKTLYGRLGRPQWKFKFYAGLNHQVQWSGSPAVPFYDVLTDQVITSFPTGLDTYLKVVSGVSLNKAGDQVNGTNGVPYNEAFNRAGNHLGTLDIGFEYQFLKFQCYLYRQSIYEDGSLFYLNNISDGLYGITIKPNLLKTSKLVNFQINAEYLKTKNQGGSTFFDIPELRGFDNYFNNGIYQDSWTYKRRGIGTAFLAPVREYGDIIKDDIKDYNLTYILNNRIEMFQLTGLLKFINWQIAGRYSESNNHGNYSFKFENLKQRSIYFEANCPIKEYRCGFVLASDFGELLPNVVGIRVKVIKAFM